jgi:outer membrane protein
VATILERYGANGGRERLSSRAKQAGTALAVSALITMTPGVQAADLIEVYGLAQANDAVFESAGFALQAARQKVPQAFSALLPSLDANGTVGDTRGNTVYTGTPAVSRSFRSYTWTLQLTQPVLRVQNFLAYDGSKSLGEQALAQYAQARQDLIVRVAQAYFDVVVAEESVQASAAQVKALNEQVQAATRSFSAGVASITDEDDARSRAALAESQRVAALDDLDSKRAALQAITRFEPSTLAILNPDLSPPGPDPKEVTAWVDRARQGNPNVRAVRAALDAADFDLKRTRAQRLPSIDLIASYGANFSSGNIVNPVDYASRVRDGQVSLQLSMPLLDGGGLQAQIGEARAKQRKAQADLDIAQRQAALDARQAYAGVLNGLAQVEALKAAVAAGTNSVKGNRMGYGLGIRINSDVLNAEQQLFSARRDLVKARYDTLLQGLKLKAAAGELNEEDLLAINRMLQTRRQSDGDGSGVSPSTQ